MRSVRARVQLAAVEAARGEGARGREAKVYYKTPHLPPVSAYVCARPTFPCSSAVKFYAGALASVIDQRPDYF